MRKEASAFQLTYSIAASARLLGISRTFLYELIAAGKVRTVKLGKRRLVPYAELERLTRETKPSRLAPKERVRS